MGVHNLQPDPSFELQNDVVLLNLTANLIN